MNRRGRSRGTSHARRGPGRGRGRGQAQPGAESDDTEYTPPTNVPHQRRRGDQITHQALNDAGEHIDITLSDEGSDQEDDVPPTLPDAPGPPDAAVRTTLVAQPTPVPAPSSQARSSRGHVAHDINHFFRRGTRGQEGSLTVCKKCE